MIWVVIKLKLVNINQEIKRHINYSLHSLHMGYLIYLKAFKWTLSLLTIIFHNMPSFLQVLDTPYLPSPHQNENTIEEGVDCDSISCGVERAIEKKKTHS